MLRILGPLSLMAIVMMPCTQTAFSQSAPVDLRLKNEQLEAQVSDLQSTLEAARKRIQELEAKIQRISNSKADESLPVSQESPVDTSQTPSTPISNQNPAAIQRALLQEYAVAFDESKLTTPGSSEWRNDDSAYRKWLQVWITATNRLHQKRVDWTVVLQRTFQLNATESVVTLAPWDSERQEIAGDSFQSRVPSRTLDRIRRVMENKQKNIPLRLKGVYIPRLQLNPKRLNPGPFDNPPLIGPMVELNWSIDIKSLSPVVSAEKESRSQERNPKNGS